MHNEVVGDPLEVSAFKAFGWKFSSPRVATLNREEGEATAVVSLLLRFPFASTLQRTTAVAEYRVKSDVWRGPLLNQQQQQQQQDGVRLRELLQQHPRGYLIAVKGAPEKIKSFLSKPPSFYDDMAAQLTRRGFRVLALGVRLSAQNPQGLSRSALEENLFFCGFLCFAAAVKRGVQQQILLLQRSGVQPVMLTGDHALTAAAVAADVGILHHPAHCTVPSCCSSSKRKCSSSNKLLPLFLSSASEVEPQQPQLSDQPHASSGLRARRSAAAADKKEQTTTATDDSGSSSSSSRLEWVSADGSVRLPFSAVFDLSFSELFGFCVSGAVLQQQQQQQRRELLRQLVRFVRVYARLSPDQKQEVVDAYTAEGLRVLMCGDGTNDVGALRSAAAGVSVLSAAAPRQQQQQQPQKQQREALEKVLQELDGVSTLVPLGSASVAAAFTSREDGISVVSRVVAESRSCLSCLLLMHKLTALNCAVSAFSLSVLSTDGVRLSDLQAALEGCISTMLTVCVTTAAEETQQQQQQGRGLFLGDRPPPKSVFSVLGVVSLLAQSCMHVWCLSKAWAYGRALRDSSSSSSSSGDEFEPDAVNTAVFYMMLAMHISTLLANYPGRPWAASLRENKKLLRILFASTALLLLLLLQLMPALNHALDLVVIQDTQFFYNLLLLLVADVAAPWAVAAACAAAATATQQQVKPLAQLQ
ncbi:hypothetical protein Esti_002364 [Eimeria stiedai]